MTGFVSMPSGLVVGRDLLFDNVMLPSGLLVPEAAVARAKLAGARRPKALDVFAGAGGFSLGAIQGGFEVVGAVEQWPDAVMTYMSNLCRYGEVQMHFVEEPDRRAMEKQIAGAWKREGLRIGPEGVERDGKISAKAPALAGQGWISHQPRDVPGVSHIFVGDVRRVTGKRVLAALGMERGELDCVMGGPPCQGFSVSGKRDVLDPRNSLVFEFARLIVELNPKTMVMENVPAIATMVTQEGDPVLDRFCRILEDGGFGTVDAFRRTVERQVGSIGLMRGKPRASRKEKPEPEITADIADHQMSLFEEASQ